MGLNRKRNAERVRRAGPEMGRSRERAGIAVRPFRRVSPRICAKLAPRRKSITACHTTVNNTFVQAETEGQAEAGMLEPVGNDELPPDLPVALHFTGEVSDPVRSFAPRTCCAAEVCEGVSVAQLRSAASFVMPDADDARSARARSSTATMRASASPVTRERLATTPGLAGRGGSSAR